MSGFIDLHSHWVPNIDDGVTSAEDGIALLQALASAGFEKVIATPHMRPGMFDNTPAPAAELGLMVRHRLGSYAQESTRYCNYSKGKFGEEITCIEPELVTDGWAWDATCEAWADAEARYLALLRNGVKPEIAREVLPIGLKAEIVVGANTREWRHIFGQRCSPKAHPRMRELMIPLLAEIQERVPVLYDSMTT